MSKQGHLPPGISYLVINLDIHELLPQLNLSRQRCGFAHFPLLLPHLNSDYEYPRQ